MNNQIYKKVTPLRTKKQNNLVTPSGTLVPVKSIPVSQ
jgi:hypothetical protein